jgi:hypothetical protein
MSKFSVNGVEVIRDDAKIDWSRIAGRPVFLPGFNPVNRVVNSGEFRSYALEDDGTGRVRLVETRYDCDSINCDCNCGGG